MLELNDAALRPTLLLCRVSLFEQGCAGVIQILTANRIGMRNWRTGREIRAEPNVNGQGAIAARPVRLTWREDCN